MESLDNAALRPKYCTSWCPGSFVVWLTPCLRGTPRNCPWPLSISLSTSYGHSLSCCFVSPSEANLVDRTGRLMRRCAGVYLIMSYQKRSGSLGRTSSCLDASSPHLDNCPWRRWGSRGYRTCPLRARLISLDSWGSSRPEAV